MPKLRVVDKDSPKTYIVKPYQHFC